MAESIVYRLEFSDEDESVMSELISIGFEALDTCQQESLKLAYFKALNKIERLVIDAITALYQDSAHKPSDPDIRNYLKPINCGNYAKTIQNGFEIYRLLGYPAQYHEFLVNIQHLIGLGSSALIRAFPKIATLGIANKEFQLQLSTLPQRYSSFLHKSQTLNRDIWEAIHGIRNPKRLNEGGESQG